MINYIAILEYNNEDIYNTKENVMYLLKIVIVLQKLLIS